MSRNLEQKLAQLLEETERFSRSDRMRAILAFVKSELNLMETRHNWTERDLNLIRSRAVSIMTDMSLQTELEGRRLYSNDDLARFYCIAQATYEYLRGEGMTPYIIHLEPRKQAPVCLHPEDKIATAGQGILMCTACDQEVRAVGYSTVRKKT